LFIASYLSPYSIIRYRAINHIKVVECFSIRCSSMIIYKTSPFLSISIKSLNGKFFKGIYLKHTHNFLAT